jgi:uncharacterized protein with von Willebrand factor type A (vWA) domain
MIHGLQRFFDALDKAGIRTSPAERIDAIRALEGVGIEDASRFRQALRATLVKRAGQRIAFDEVFDRFFVGPGRARGRRRRRGAGGRESGQEKRAQKRGETQSSGVPREVRQAPERDRPRRSSRQDRRDDTEAMEDRLRALRDGGRGRWGRLRHVHANESTERRTQAAAREVPPPLRELRRGLTTEQEHALAREVRRLVERIRLRTGRRLRATASGRPYMRRVFRDSQRTGGVPFRLPRRRPRHRTPRVVLLIDVSWSTAPAARLFLEMAGEFLRLGRQSRVLFFVDRPAEATEPLARWLERRKPGPFETLLRSIPGLNLDAPSDYGRVFHSLSVSPSRPRGRRTVLVVLGDGRTNVFDPLAWALDEIVEGCGAALWLVPEPVARWATGDSALPLYLPCVDTVVEVGDLAGLARGVTELLRRL